MVGLPLGNEDMGQGVGLGRTGREGQVGSTPCPPLRTPALISVNSIQQVALLNVGGLTQSTVGLNGTNRWRKGRVTPSS